jgi:DNA-directed RNA polymerase specialized sigma24 family protein
MTHLDSIFSRRKESTLTQESFTKLLAWLHEDYEEAGRIYEDVRSKLIRGFKSHGCTVGEDLADETINRVTRKLPEIVDRYVGDPKRYFFGVAYKVLQEYQRHATDVVPLPPREIPFEERRDDSELVYGCLEMCLSKLAPQSRELILQFYQGEKQVKIKRRKELAHQMNTKLGNLRLQAHRIRLSLRKCIMACLEQKPAGLKQP